MDDKNMPNQSANKTKAEGERWDSNADTGERRPDAESGRTDTAGSRGQENAGGITNRPLDEEEENQEAVPEPGESREGAHAGHGDTNRSEK